MRRQRRAQGSIHPPTPAATLFAAMPATKNQASPHKARAYASLPQGALQSCLRFFSRDGKAGRSCGSGVFVAVATTYFPDARNTRRALSKQRCARRETLTAAQGTRRAHKAREYAPRPNGFPSGTTLPERPKGARPFWKSPCKWEIEAQKSVPTLRDGKPTKPFIFFLPPAAQ